MALPVNIEQLLNGKTVEWDRLEFKQGWNPEEIIHSICAFANDLNNWGGGYIIVGVAEANGCPILPPAGLTGSNLDTIQKELLNLCYQVEPFVQVVSEPTVYHEKRILVIWVPGGDLRPYKAPSTLGNKSQKRYYVRHGSVSKVANKVEEDQLMMLASKVPFDDRINHQATISDLSMALIRTFLHDIKSELENDVTNIPFIDLCRQMQIVGGTTEYTKPKNVGLLMFSENPSQFIPCSRIEIVQFMDEVGDQFSEKIFSGPIHEQLRDALHYIQDQIIIRKVIKIPQQAEALRVYNYPYEAIEEALSNAVYHKSYDLQNPIEIRINHDSINILSFEGPMPPIKNVDLQKERVITRQYRNRRIGDFLKELRYTEGRSTGFPKIRRSLKNNGSPSAKLETDENNSYFLATIYIHPLFLNKSELLEKRAVQIIDFCREPRSGREIFTHIGVSYHTTNFRKIIDPLVNAGYLYLVGESSKKKYVAIELVSG